MCVFRWGVYGTMYFCVVSEVWCAVLVCLKTVEE